MDITLNVPTHIYERAQQIASTTNQPIEVILLQQLESVLGLPQLSPDEQKELDALRTMADEQMPQPKQDHMKVLMDKNSIGTISDQDYETLNQLVEQGQRLMLLKAQAMRLLSERIY